MTNWFDDPNREEASTGSASPKTPVTEETATGAEPANTPEPTANEWRSSGTPEAPETPAAPPAGQPASYSPGWSQPAQSTPPSNPYMPRQQTPPPTGAWQQPPVPQPPKKKKHGMTIFASILAVVCVVSLTASAVLALHTLQSSASDGGTSAGDTQGETNTPKVEIAEPTEEGLTTPAIIKKNLASVVTLQIYTESQTFFGGSGVLTQSGVASGIVWTEDGYIITNSHCVLDDNTSQAYPRIDVELSDGTVYESVSVVGADSTTDLAVVKIDSDKLKEKLSPAEFGDSSALSMGDKVIAIGNPGGLGLTATQGIVSGLTRDVYDDTGYAIPCIQIDAAINPGNSGGPLFNAAGQVIAINSSKIVATGYEGLGFAIPINEAKTILDDLVSRGHVSGRVALGITGQTVSTTGIQGFYIASIEEGSCLENTRVRVGDIIIYLDEQRVTDYSELRSALAAHKVGDQVTLTLLRYNEATRTFDQYTASAALGESKE